MKKFFSIIIIFCFAFCSTPAIAACSCNESVQYTHTNPQSSSKCPCNKINETENYYIILRGNVIKLAFECKFLSEDAKEGDEIFFYLPKDITDSCGNIILPVGTKFSGCVRNIYKQRKFNKNARVYIGLNKLILPCGEEIDIKIKPFNKDFSLVENGWMTAGKIAANTVGLGAIGTGAGVGLAFIPRPHKIAIGAGTGVAIGCFLGLVTGLVTPGLKYHAKQGEEVKFVFCDDACIPKSAVKIY